MTEKTAHELEDRSVKNHTVWIAEEKVMKISSTQHRTHIEVTTPKHSA